VEYDGEMSYNAADELYIFNSKVGTLPGNQITAQSDQLGSDIWYFNDGVNQPPEALNQNVQALPHHLPHNDGDTDKRYSPMFPTDQPHPRNSASSIDIDGKSLQTSSS
jgi:hypothetical protein